MYSIENLKDDRLRQPYIAAISTELEILDQYLSIKI